MEYWQQQRHDRLIDPARQPFPVAFKESGDQTSFLYLPDEFLVHSSLVGPLGGLLADPDIVAPPPDRLPSETWLEGSGLRVYGYRGDPQSLPGRVAQMRAAAGDNRVSLHYVMTAEIKPTVPRGGPAAPPVPSPGAPRPANWSDGRGEPVVAILDTGLFRGSQAERARGVAGHAVSFRPFGQTPNDIDELYPLHADGTPYDTLAPEAGHGSFIASLIQRMAGEGIHIEAWKVLDAEGLGSERTIVEALKEIRTRADQLPRVINLSLGGFTDDGGWFDPVVDPDLAAMYEERKDLMPLGLAFELAQWVGDPWNQTVFVCAAGNDGKERPFWPAAAAREVEDDERATIVAVAALDEHLEPTDFTNRGTWVSVGTIGTNIWSDYPRGAFEIASGSLLTFAEGASWSGTSFAAPLVTAEIARRAVDLVGGQPRSGRSAWAWLHTHLEPRRNGPLLGRVWDPRENPPHLNPCAP